MSWGKVVAWVLGLVAVLALCLVCAWALAYRLAGAMLPTPADPPRPSLGPSTPFTGPMPKIK